MILVLPEAAAGIGSYDWFSYDNPNTGQPYIDDADFLVALVNHLAVSGLNVNTNRIFLSAFSNGGSMTLEIWRYAPANRTQEVIFVGLSDGGHRWPDSADKVPFNASLEVLKFFEAH